MFCNLMWALGTRECQVYENDPAAHNLFTFCVLHFHLKKLHKNEGRS